MVANILVIIDIIMSYNCLFFFSSRRRHTRLQGDWSSDVCSSDLVLADLPTDTGLPLLLPLSRRRFSLNLWKNTGYWGRAMYVGYYRRSEEHTSELQSPCNLVCRLLLEKKKKKKNKQSCIITKSNEV